jgi:hypothetical protein
VWRMVNDGCRAAMRIDPFWYLWPDVIRQRQVDKAGGTMKGTAAL